MAEEIVLITGASSGIGCELAKLFAAEGCRLILVARSEDKLNEHARQLESEYGTHSTVIPMDLAQPGAAIQLFDKVQSMDLQVDTLVNNAGFGQMGRFDGIPLERHTNMCQLNMVALTQLFHLFLPQMKERNRGGILNIGSTASYQPGPNSAVYYATKAYVLSLSEAVHAELWGTNVKVTCLCPGPTKTGFGADSEMGDLAMFKYNVMDVTKVAKAGHAGLRKGKRVVMPGLINQLLAFSNRFTAKPIILSIMKKLQPVD